MDFTKLNKGGKKFTYELPQNAEFKKLQSFKEGEQYQVLGLFIGKSKNQKFKPHPVAVGHDFFIDLPQYAVDQVNEMLSDQEIIDCINAGQCGIEVTVYENPIEKGKMVNGFRWINWGQN